jgi:hypothetical protein
VKRKIVFLPIELYEERYSAQWYIWFTSAFAVHGIDYIRFGDDRLRVIDKGQFLDVVETNTYKLQQAAAAIEYLRYECDWPLHVFALDLWNPCILNIAYVAKCLDLDVKFSGILHAGTWDKHDYLSQKGFGKWAQGFERSLLDLVDRVYVGTKFHRWMIERYFSGYAAKMKVVPFPVIQPDAPLQEKERLVVWPHRNAIEKNKKDWYKIIKLYKLSYPDDQVEWVSTADTCETKEMYYKCLARAKVVVSTAHQETFGIAMLEGVNFNAYPVVPNRLSYCELYDKEFRYETLEGAVALIKRHLDAPVYVHQRENDLSWVKELAE